MTNAMKMGNTLINQNSVVVHGSGILGDGHPASATAKNYKPFILLSTSVSLTYNGTGCGDGARATVSIIYSGDIPPQGKFLDVYYDYTSHGYEFVASYPVSSFPLTNQATQMWQSNGGADPTLAFGVQIIDGSTTKTDSVSLAKATDCYAP